MIFIETKTDKVRRLVAEGDYKQALQICKDWDYPYDYMRDLLRRGYECYMYPSFYKQLGYDPPKEYEKAVEFLKNYYK